MPVKYIILLLIIVFSGNSCSALSEDARLKREKIRYALKEELLDICDIPFATYASLEMWEELDQILENSHQNMVQHRLPGLYYSRPYTVKGGIWVFENNSDGNREIHVFDADDLKLSETLQKRDFSAYEGGIRTVSGDHIISGGSDRDVDRAVVWNTGKDEVRSLKLKEGHYITSLHASGDILCAGSCGGLISAWHMPDLSFIRNYSTSSEANSSWEIFNRKPCINALYTGSGQMIGAGERNFFIWDQKSGNLLRKFEKKLPHSQVFFYQHFAVEYKEDRLAVRDLKNGNTVRELKTDAFVNDLLVTEETVLPHQRGPLIIISLRHNKGIFFYDFDTMTLLRKSDFKGESLHVFRQQIYATDDRHIYKYNIRHRIPENCKTFLQDVRPEKLEITESMYRSLLQRSLDYPDVMDTAALSRKYLAQHGLELHYAFRYGRIRAASSEKEKNSFGYNLIYEIKNVSENGLFLAMHFRWSGEYGRRSDTESEGGSVEEIFFIPPGKGKVTGIISVGEKEPVRMQIYPRQIDRAPPDYYEGLQRALSKKNKEISIIESYLRDERVRRWHPALKLRKREITDIQEKNSLLLKILQ